VRAAALSGRSAGVRGVARLRRTALAGPLAAVLAAIRVLAVLLVRAAVRLPPRVVLPAGTARLPVSRRRVARVLRVRPWRRVTGVLLVRRWLGVAGVLRVRAWRRVTRLLRVAARRCVAARLLIPGMRRRAAPLWVPALRCVAGVLLMPGLLMAGALLRARRRAVIPARGRGLPVRGLLLVRRRLAVRCLAVRRCLAALRRVAGRLWLPGGRRC
jgi:hypothetical protein